MTDQRNLATRSVVEAGLRRRNRREIIFKSLGIAATLVGVLFLLTFFWTLGAEGASAFRQTYLEIEVDFDEA